jgi:hypothetical protein
VIRTKTRAIRHKRPKPRQFVSPSYPPTGAPFCPTFARQRSDFSVRQFPFPTTPIFIIHNPYFLIFPFGAFYLVPPVPDPVNIGDSRFSTRPMPVPGCHTPAFWTNLRPWQASIAYSPVDLERSPRRCSVAKPVNIDDCRFLISCKPPPPSSWRQFVPAARIACRVFRIATEFHSQISSGAPNRCPSVPICG